MSDPDPHALVVSEDPHYTPERLARRRAAEDAFMVRLAPIVREVIAPIVERFMHEPVPIPAAEFDAFLHNAAVVVACVDVADSLDAASRDALEKRCEAHFIRDEALEEGFAEHVERVETHFRTEVAREPTAAEIASELEKHVVSVARGLLANWPLDVLELAGEGGVIPRSRLDDCSMPTGFNEEVYAPIGWQIDLGLDDLREILRKLRASLPPDELLPPEVVEILATYDVALEP